MQEEALQQARCRYRHISRPSECLSYPMYDYPGLEKVCEIASSIMRGPALPFLGEGRSIARFDELQAKYQKAAAMKPRKLGDWILENVSEADFVALIEAIADQADTALIKKVDAILRGISWDRECLVRQPLNIESHVAKVILIRNHNAKALKKKGLEHLDYKPDIYQIFFRDVVPKSIQGDATAEARDYSEEELRHYADLRHIPNKQGHEALQQEHDQITGQLEKKRTLPLAEIRRLKKRQMELEFIYLLMPFNNKDVVHETTKASLQQIARSEAEQATSFDHTGRASILYSMITGETCPEPENLTTYSHSYFVTPMLAIIPLLKTPCT